MGARHYIPKPDWLFECEVGDVFEDRSSGGALRVLRGMSTKNGMLTYGQFAIRRASWTGRAYTTLTYSDMLSRGFRPTGARVALDTEMDFKLEAALKQPAKMAYVLGAKDVVGVLS